MQLCKVTQKLHHQWYCVVSCLQSTSISDEKLDVTEIASATTIEYNCSLVIFGMMTHSLNKTVAVTGEFCLPTQKSKTIQFSATWKNLKPPSTDRKGNS